MADGNITVEVSTQAAQAELERLRAENARLAREAHAWWTAARDATVAERERCAQRVALHSQYPIQTDYDRGYDKARKDAAETLRNMSTYVSTYAPDRPSTPVGWSDTLRAVIDWAVLYCAWSIQFAASGSHAAAFITASAVGLYGCWCFYDGSA